MLVSKVCWFLFTLPRAYQVAAYTSLSSASSKPFATVSAHRRPHVAVARRYCLVGRDFKCYPCPAQTDGCSILHIKPGTITCGKSCLHREGNQHDGLL